MSTTDDPVKVMLGELDGRTFKSWPKFLEAFEKAFSKHRARVPLSYTPLQGVVWGRQNGWLTDSDAGLHVQVC